MEAFVLWDSPLGISFGITHGTYHGIQYSMYDYRRGVPHGNNVAHGIMVPAGKLHEVPQGTHTSYSVHRETYHGARVFPWGNKLL